VIPDHRSLRTWRKLVLGKSAGSLPTVFKRYRGGYAGKAVYMSKGRNDQSTLGGLSMPGMGTVGALPSECIAKGKV